MAAAIDRKTEKKEKTLKPSLGQIFKLLEKEKEEEEEQGKKFELERGIMTK